jgi:hypothetical protein
MDILAEALLGHALAEAKASDDHYLPIESAGAHWIHKNLPPIGLFKYEGTFTIGLASASIAFKHFMKPLGPVNKAVDWCRYLQGSIEATLNRFTPKVIKGGKKGIKKKKSGWHTGARFINRPDTYARMLEAFVCTTFVQKALDDLRQSVHEAGNAFLLTLAKDLDLTEEFILSRKWIKGQGGQGSTPSKSESQSKSQKKKRKASKVESESSGTESETTGAEGPRRSPRTSKQPTAEAEQPETEEAQPPKDETKA